METGATVPMFNYVDLIALLLLIYGAVRGAYRGLSGELTRTVGLILTILAGWFFHRPLGEILARGGQLSPDASYITAFLLVIAAAVAVLLLVRVLFRRILEFSFKGRIERWGGAIAGLVLSAFLTAMLFVSVGLIPQPALHRAVAEDSWLGRRVCGCFPDLYRDLSDRYGLPPLPAGRGTAPPGLPPDATDDAADGRGEPAPAPGTEDRIK